ncbi:MAG TPA: toxin-antitoxin system YwqK family antitoxin [Myxococcales bacterium]|nr:toxin-antitoxin system YwqK family antitoxin [Myxococcales bacterium]
MVRLVTLAVWSSVALAGGEEAPVACPPGAQRVATRSKWGSEEYCAIPSAQPQDRWLKEGPYRQIGASGSRTEGAYAGGAQHGVWRSWNEAGKLLREEGYDRGQVRLPWRHFYPDGTPQDESVAREGGGRTNRSWHRNGQVRSEGSSNAAGQADGVVKQWSEKGQLLSEETYRGGAKDGPSRKWHPNGKLAEETSWRAGTQVGAARTWAENGELREEVKYDDAGKEVGWAAYGPGGRKRTAGPCADDGDCALAPAPVCGCGSGSSVGISLVDRHYGRIPQPPANCPPGPYACMPPPRMKPVCKAGKCEAVPER